MADEGTGAEVGRAAHVGVGADRRAGHENDVLAHQDRAWLDVAALAHMDAPGGDVRAHDAGVPVDHDRTLVRVLGPQQGKARCKVGQGEPGLEVGQ